MTACTPYAFEWGAWAAALFGAALLAGAYLVRKVLQAAKLVDVEVTDRDGDREISVLRLEPWRLRRRPMPANTSTEQYALPLERRYPELATRLRETARRLALAMGEITSDDVWDAHPIPAGVEPRIMAAAFKPRKDWIKTGVYVPTRRPSANKRPIPRWRLREAVAA